MDDKILYISYQPFDFKPYKIIKNNESFTELDFIEFISTLNSDFTLIIYTPYSIKDKISNTKISIEEIIE